MLKVFKDMMQRDNQDPEKESLLKSRKRKEDVSKPFEKSEESSGLESKRKMSQFINDQRKVYNYRVQNAPENSKQTWLFDKLAKNKSKAKDVRNKSSKGSKGKSIQTPNADKYYVHSNSDSDDDIKKKKEEYSRKKRESRKESRKEKKSSKSKSQDDTCSCVSCAFKKFLSSDYTCIYCLSILFLISVAVAFYMVFRSIPILPANTTDSGSKCSKPLFPNSDVFKGTVDDIIRGKDKRSIYSDRWGGSMVDSGELDDLQEDYKKLLSKGQAESVLKNDAGLHTLDLYRVLDEAKIFSGEVSVKLVDFYNKLIATDKQIKQLKKYYPDSNLSAYRGKRSVKSWLKKKKEKMNLKKKKIKAKLKAKTKKIKTKKLKKTKTKKKKQHKAKLTTKKIKSTQQVGGPVVDNIGTATTPVKSAGGKEKSPPQPTQPTQPTPQNKDSKRDRRQIIFEFPNLSNKSLPKGFLLEKKQMILQFYPGSKGKTDPKFPKCSHGSKQNHALMNAVKTDKPDAPLPSELENFLDRSISDLSSQFARMLEKNKNLEQLKELKKAIIMKGIDEAIYQRTFPLKKIPATETTTEKYSYLDLLEEPDTSNSYMDTESIPDITPTKPIETTKTHSVTQTVDYGHKLTTKKGPSHNRHFFFSDKDESTVKGNQSPDKPTDKDKRKYPKNFSPLPEFKAVSQTYHPENKKENNTKDKKLYKALTKTEPKPKVQENSKNDEGTAYLPGQKPDAESHQDSNQNLQNQNQDNRQILRKSQMKLKNKQKLAQKDTHSTTKDLDKSENYDSKAEESIYDETVSLRATSTEPDTSITPKNHDINVDRALYSGLKDIYHSTERALSKFIKPKTNQIEHKGTEYLGRELSEDYFTESESEYGTPTANSFDILLSISTLINPIHKDAKYDANEILAKLPTRKLLQNDEEEVENIGYEDLKEVLSDDKDSHDEMDRQVDRRRRQGQPHSKNTDKISTKPNPPIALNNPNWKGAMPLYPDELKNVLPKTDKKPTLKTEEIINEDDEDIRYIDEYTQEHDKLVNMAQAYSDYGVLEGKKDIKIEKEGSSKVIIENRAKMTTRGRIAKQAEPDKSRDGEHCKDKDKDKDKDNKGSEPEKKNNANSTENTESSPKESGDTDSMQELNVDDKSKKDSAEEKTSDANSYEEKISDANSKEEKMSDANSEEEKISDANNEEEKISDSNNKEEKTSDANSGKEKISDANSFEEKISDAISTEDNQDQEKIASSTDSDNIADDKSIRENGEDTMQDLPNLPSLPTPEGMDNVPSTESTDFDIVVRNNKGMYSEGLRIEFKPGNPPRDASDNFEWKSLLGTLGGVIRRLKIKSDNDVTSKLVDKTTEKTTETTTEPLQKNNKKPTTQPFQKTNKKPTKDVKRAQGFEFQRFRRSLKEFFDVYGETGSSVFDDSISTTTVLSPVEKTTYLNDVIDNPLDINYAIDVYHAQTNDIDFEKYTTSDYGDYNPTTSTTDESVFDELTETNNILLQQGGVEIGRKLRDIKSIDFDIEKRFSNILKKEGKINEKGTTETNTRYDISSDIKFIDVDNEKDAKYKTEINGDKIQNPSNPKSEELTMIETTKQRSDDSIQTELLTNEKIKDINRVKRNANQNTQNDFSTESLNTDFDPLSVYTNQNTETTESTEKENQMNTDFDPRYTIQNAELIDITTKLQNLVTLKKALSNLYVPDKHSGDIGNMFKAVSDWFGTIAGVVVLNKTDPITHLLNLVSQLTSVTYATERSVVYPNYDAEMVDNIGHRSRMLLSVAEDKTKEDNVTTKEEEEEKKSSSLVTFAITQTTVNITTATLAPNQTNIKLKENTKQEQNKTVVKRSSDNTNLFWNDIYDDEYGIEDPLEKNLREKHGNDLVSKSGTWIQDKVKRLTYSIRKAGRDEFDKLAGAGRLNRDIGQTETFLPADSEHKINKRESEEPKINRPLEDVPVATLNMQELRTHMKSVCLLAADAVRKTRNTVVPSNEREQEATTSMMQKLVKLMSDLVNFQVQQRTCMTLPPDLRGFLDWLTSPEVPQNRYITIDGLDNKDDDYKDNDDQSNAASSEKDEGHDARSECLGTLHAVQDLLQQYSEMDDEDKNKMVGVKEYLEDQLNYLNRHLNSLNEPPDTRQVRYLNNQKFYEDFDQFRNKRNSYMKKYIKSNTKKHTKNTNYESLIITEPTIFHHGGDDEGSKDDSNDDDVDEGRKPRFETGDGKTTEEETEEDKKFEKAKRNLKDVYYKAVNDATKYFTTDKTPQTHKK